MRSAKRLSEIPLLFCALFFALIIPTWSYALPSAPQQTQRNESQPQENAQALINQAKPLLQSRQYAKAADVLKQAIALQPDSAAAHAHLSIAVLRLGRASEALSLAQRAVQLDPAYAFSYVALGEANLTMNRFDDAIEALKAAIRINPNYANAYGVLGSLYGQTRRYEESLEAFKNALRLEANNADSLNGLAIAQYRLGHHEEGIAAVKEAVKLNPNFANAYINLGNWNNELGRYEEAVDAFTNVIRIAPRFAYAYFSRSLANFYLGRGDAAGDDAKVFLSLGDWSRERAPFMAIVGTLGYLKAGREEDANKLLNQAQKRLSTTAWPYPVIAYLHKELSKDALLAAATDNDKMTEARAYLGLALAIAGQREEALKQLHWVKENGNKQFVEYPAAMLELRRLEQAQSEPVRQRL